MQPDGVYMLGGKKMKNEKKVAKQSLVNRAIQAWKATEEGAKRKTHKPNSEVC